MTARHLALAFALGAGCGRIGFGGTAEIADAPEGTDGAIVDAPVTAFGPWSAPEHLTMFQSTDNDWEPALDATGLVLVFSRGGSLNSNLLVATRPDLGSPFGPATLIPGASSAAYEYGAAWSYDNTRLYFRYESGPTSEPRYLTSLGNGTFSALSTPATELPGDGSSWTFSKDGLEVFYTTAPAVGEYDLHRATRPDLTSSFTIDDGPIQKLQRASGSEGWPTLDATGSTLYVEWVGPSGGTLQQSTRSSPGAAFEALQPTTYIQGADDGDPDLSRDGRTLIFSSSRLTGLAAELFVMTRSPL